ncbi:NAD-dependent succinate-semialdehyde dehydrogenase [Exiguobacterium profundum]|uniref:NAD-dependent succinate-semialdehyde dehydrogenase n=1 Tax=Exiguobacterium TaxID=33986 RepID=UPI0018C37A89|nr:MULTISPECIES: NAD-dependent succinate-semialdehyde dehydrogenase [Exiguobacterium]MBG0918188.1 NAD-dependent succinate-semialdehyde dehydrogenase [Exiguobacterium sp. SRB7LM]MCT4798350.1 NAD-dependent succinate-semialdehyde dehydrogenase [Exiguobacterium profundum]MDT0192721.1 NAD-dependent succinate-semialdehyde dehydrogenase [Exiguobacterium sp. BG5(2022)]
MREEKNFINGEWTETGQTIEVRNPATGNVMAVVTKSDTQEATQAVDAAHEALEEWQQKTAEERGELLTEWHRLIAEHTEELARTMVEEQGKPLKEAIGEINYANGFIDWYAAEGRRVYGETIPASSNQKRIFAIKQPVGVIAAITPWNFPAAMITRKVAPALAAGCTVVMKPASATPLTAIELVKLAEKAGFPKGVINLVTGQASDIVKAWQQDKRVRKLTFTGSTEVGKMLMRDAADTMKKISLELGGHAPLIVTAKADLDKAVPQAVATKFRNGGQTCVCANRIYVERAVVDEFSERFIKEVEALKVGNGLEEGVDIGPLIDDDALSKVEKHIEDAQIRGGEVYGGEVLDGLFIRPAVIRYANEDMLCMNEETFGPVAPIATFDSLDEVIKRANNTPFGLAAYLFTQDINEAVYLAESLEYGIVGVNDGLPSTPQAPFGGWKESGLGREGGHHGIEEFLEVKYISLGL